MNSRRTRFFTLLAATMLSCMLLLSGCIKEGNREDGGLPAQEGEEIQWQNFSSSLWAFQIDYPENAEKMINNDTTDMFSLRFEIPTRHYAMISVQKTGNITLEEWVASNLDQMNSSEDYQEADISTGNWEHLDAATLVTVENYPSGTRKIKQKIILAIGTNQNNQEYAYRVLFTTNQDKFDTAWSNYFSQMAHSFEFI